MDGKIGRVYVLVEIVPGKEQEFANEVVSRGLMFDSKVDRMDFVHGDFDFVLVLSGSTSDIDRRILDMRKLPYVRKTHTLTPFETLNWEVISAMYSEAQLAPMIAQKGKKAVREMKASKKILVLYSSISGNTEKMAVAVAEGVKTIGNIQVELKRFIKAEDLSNFDALIVGAPTYKDDMPVDLKQFFEEAKEKNVNLKDKIGASFGSYGWGGEAPKNALDIMKYKFEMKTPEAPLLVKQTPDQKALGLCRDLGKRISERTLRPS